MLFGFDEVWRHLKLDVYKNLSFKTIDSSPFSKSPDAAYLDPEGAKKLLSLKEIEKLNESSSIQMSELSDNIKKVLNVQDKFLRSNKLKADVLQLSKKSVVDFVQENIRKYYAGKGEQLSPIIFGLEHKIEGDHPYEKSFNPELQKVFDKGRNSYTAAELRMVYKLTNEIPDEDVRHIATQSFRFVKVVQTITDAYKRGGITYHVESMPQPWCGEAETDWLSRARKENRSCYEKREGNLPDWVDRLITYKNAMKEASTKIVIT